MAKTHDTYTFKEKIWLYPGMQGAWHFISVPKKASTMIKERQGKNRRGFGAIAVSVTIERTTWTTSIFPESRSGLYILPLKASVRKAEGLMNGESAKVTLTIR